MARPLDTDVLRRAGGATQADLDSALETFEQTTEQLTEQVDGAVEQFDELADQVREFPVRRSLIDRALVVIDRRRRPILSITSDGVLRYGRALIERIGDFLRIRGLLGSRGIEIGDDDSFYAAGERRRPIEDGSTIRRVVAPRQRLIEELSKDGYKVFGFRANSDGSVSVRGLTVGADGAVKLGLGEQIVVGADGAVVLGTEGQITIGADGSLSLAGGLIDFDEAGNVAIGAMEARADGSLVLAGEHRRETSLPFIRAMTGARRRIFEKLDANGYMVHGLRVRRDGQNLVLLMDDQPVVRVSSQGVPKYVGGTYLVTQGDTYLREGEGYLPVLTDMSRWSIWGSSTAEFLGNDLAALAATRGVSFLGNGKGNERIEHTTARLGSHPALLTFPGNQIPASGSVDLPLPTGWTTSFALLSYTGTVAGVAGTLSTGPSNSQVTFTRTAAGDPVDVDPDVPFLPTRGLSRRNAFNMLNLGRNSITTGRPTDEIIQISKEAFDWLSPLIKRSLVLNHHCTSEWTPSSPLYIKTVTINEAYAAYFGNHVVDLQGWVCQGKTLGELVPFWSTTPDGSKTIWNVTGITPNADSIAAQEIGVLPAQLAQDSIHFSSATDAAVTWLIDRQMIALGYYD